MHPRAAELITNLQLERHPEGGYYREIFRSADLVQPADGRGPRAALTTIYFLLPAGVVCFAAGLAWLVRRAPLLALGAVAGYAALVVAAHLYLYAFARGSL